MNLENLKISILDNVPIGSTSSSTPSLTLSPRLELYRPFAAHCIGFPVVTLGFRVKSFFRFLIFNRLKGNVKIYSL